MAVYPTTLAEWQAMGYTRFQADFERWKRDMDVLVAIMDERISSLTILHECMRRNLAIPDEDA